MTTIPGGLSVDPTAPGENRGGSGAEILLFGSDTTKVSPSDAKFVVFKLRLMSGDDSNVVVKVERDKETAEIRAKFDVYYV